MGNEIFLFKHFLCDKVNEILKYLSELKDLKIFLYVLVYVTYFTWPK